MSKAKDKDSNKENYNYNISAHKIAIVIWIIIIFLLCVFILPFLLSSVAKILDNVSIINEKVLPDFLGGMIGIVIGFFIESGLIKKYRRIDDFKAVYDSLEVYFGELKEKIENDIEIENDREKENDIKNDAIDFNPYRYDFQLLRDVTNSIEKDSLFLNLPNYALSDSKEGKNIHRLLHEIKSNVDDYDYYKSCYERTLEYMSDDRSIVNKRTIKSKLSEMNENDFSKTILDGEKCYEAKGFFEEEKKIFHKYIFIREEDKVVWKSNIVFTVEIGPNNEIIKIEKKENPKELNNKQDTQQDFNDLDGFTTQNIFGKELMLWEKAYDYETDQDKKNKLGVDINYIYLMFQCYLRRYYLNKMQARLKSFLNNINKFDYKKK